MLTVYNLIMRSMNGTVTMMTDVSTFASRELAEETKAALERENVDSIFPVICEIKEGKVYENKEEVTILNKK